MKKCDHIPEEKKTFLSVAMNETVTDIFRKCHDHAGQNYDEKTLLFSVRGSDIHFQEIELTIYITVKSEIKSQGVSVTQKENLNEGYP